MSSGHKISKTVIICIFIIFIVFLVLVPKDGKYEKNYNLNLALNKKIATKILKTCKTGFIHFGFLQIFFPNTF